MKKPIQISIPTPCHENWQAMTPADKGRFCASCQKTVIDFTKSSDREIASVLKNTENTCGRFRGGQLDRDLVIPKEKSSIWMAASAAVVSFITLGTHGISAQTPVKTEQQPSCSKPVIIGKVAAPTIKKLITGTVLDSEGHLLPGAEILNLNTEAKTYTDFEGNFYIEASKGNMLQISFPDMVYQEIVVRDDSKLKITLIDRSHAEPIYYVVGGITQGIEIVTVQRTFFGRIFHSIGNIFR